MNIPDVFSGEVADPHLRRAATNLRQSVPRNATVQALFRRNAFQVLWADAVVAVTWEDLKAAYPSRVGGGTKWAVQVYLDRFEPLGTEPAASCRLLFYEVNSAEWRRWMPLEQSWETLEEAPVLEPTWWFAGIGTRTAPDHSVTAMRQLFRSLGKPQPRSSADLSVAPNASDSPPLLVAAPKPQPVARPRRWNTAT